MTSRFYISKEFHNLEDEIRLLDLEITSLNKKIEINKIRMRKVCIGGTLTIIASLLLIAFG